MNRAATSVLQDVDLVCLLLEAPKITDDDESIMRQLAGHANLVVALNKIDKVEKPKLLPLMERIAQLLPGVDIVPLSALRRENLEPLLQLIGQRLPPGAPHFADDQITDRPMRFIVGEIIREKLFRRLERELPYSLTVDIEHYHSDDDLLRISASIWVEKKSQKGIVIGQQGSMLKKIGVEARADIERLAQRKVYLQLWVKVREDWSDDERSLAAFGYSSD